MASDESPRRIVVWSDGCAHAEPTVAWAARHAARRMLPLHILQFSAAAESAEPGEGQAHAGFAARDPAAADVVRIGHELRRIQAEHGRLPVTFQVLHDMSPQAIAGACDDGDVLVTDATSFLRLAGDEKRAVPVVVVPEHAEAATGDGGVLLMPGRAFSTPVTAFAFRAASDLGTGLDLVRVAAQSPAFGDDYWIDSSRSLDLGESRWQAVSARWRARFPDVPVGSSVLQTHPAETLASMARAARLAVVGSRSHLELRALLDIGACPVAVVREP